MLPGEVLQLFNAERFQIVQLFIGDAVLDRFDVAPIDAHEEHVEQRGDHVEVFAQGQKAQEEEEGQVVDVVGGDVQGLQRLHGGGQQALLEQPGQAHRRQELGVQPGLGVGGHTACLEQAFGDHQRRDQA